MTTTLDCGIDLLTEVVDTAEPYLSPQVVADGRQVVEQARQRRAHDPQTTIIAVAGPTGAGKSSVINALLGEDLMQVAPTRPTTSAPTAIASGDGRDLAAWLHIAHYYERPELGSLAPNAHFLLVDLPDIDSTSAANREQARAVIMAADVVIWVLDPQKYADSVVHDDYVSQMSERSAVMLTVLNQVDRLDSASLQEVVSSLHDIQHAHGVDSHIIPVSTYTGVGMEQLRAQIADFARMQAASLHKLAADMRSIGQELTQDVTPVVTEEATESNPQRFIEAAVRAAGGDVVARLAGESYAYRAQKATRWPVTRWLTAVKMDPLARFRLRVTQDSSAVTPVTGIARSEVALQQAENEYHKYVRATTAHMPNRWSSDLISDSHDAVIEIVRGADYLSAHTELETKRSPLWWRVVNICQWMLMAAVLVGALWLGGRALAVNLGIWLGRPPMVGIFPLPLVLVIGGVVAGWILSGCSRIAIGRGQQRTVRRVRKRLLAGLRTELTQRLLAPVADRVALYERTTHVAHQLTQVTDK